MILILGEILYDLFPDGRQLGGAPFNFAFHLKKLGIDVRFISRVGRDKNGRDILNFLDTHGFDTADIQIDPVHDTGAVKVSLFDDGSHGFEILADAAWDFIEFDSRLAGIMEKSFDLLYFGSLVQRTFAGRGLIQKALSHKPAPTRVFCDINLRPDAFSDLTVGTCLGASDILKLSDEEFRLISGHDPFDPEIDSLLHSFMDTHNIKTLILTLGAKGSLWALRGQVEKTGLSSLKGRITDTVGAGDAYAAMAAACLLKGAAPGHALHLAHKFALGICAIRGALPGDDGFYHKFIQKLASL